jgi:hypothetical protein
MNITEMQYKVQTFNGFNSGDRFVSTDGEVFTIIESKKMTVTYVWDGSDRECQESWWRLAQITDSKLPILTEWQDDDEVVTTFRTIKMTQQENYDAGFAAGIAWARENAK